MAALMIVVIEHEVLRVGPVVGDLGRGVVAHHVRLAAGAARRVVRIRTGRSGLVALADETVHLAAVYVGHGVRLAVRAAPVHVGGVVIGPRTAAGGHEAAPRVRREKIRARSRKRQPEAQP
jgi:hypothetical protein